MSRFFTPEEIAIILQAKLNDYSSALYESTDITKKIPFLVTADYVLYDRYQTQEYNVDDYQEFTPILLKRSFQYTYTNTDYLRYQETYSLHAYCYADQKFELEKIFKGLVQIENTTLNTETIDQYDNGEVGSTFRITKVMTDFTFNEEQFSQDGSNRKRINADSEITWNFLDGVMTSFDIDISIDGVSMPYIRFGFVDTQRPIANKTIDTTGQVIPLKSTNYYGIELVLPYINSSTVVNDEVIDGKILEIYKGLYDKKYNKKHIISYVDTAGVEWSYDVIISNKNFIDVRPQILDFSVTFIRNEGNIQIEIDDIEVPIISYNIDTQPQLVTTQNINEDKTKSAFSGIGYTISMDLDISDLTNTKTLELLSRIVKRNMNSQHKVYFSFASGLVTETYDVILQNGSYSFDTNPTGSISISFTEIDGDT